MRFKSLAKIAVSVLMLAIILSSVKTASLKQTILSIPPYIALLIVVVYTLGQMISSFKWWLIIRSGGIQVSYFQAVKAYFIGMFVNCFGLGVVGGDVARGLFLSVGQPVKAQALASVVADRAQGLAVLAAIGSIATIAFGSRILSFGVVCFLAVCSIAIVIGWFAGPWLIVRVVPRGHRFRVAVEQMAAAFPRKFKTIVVITVISFCFHMLQISLHRVMGYGLGVVIPWEYLLVVIPFVNVLSTLPISWNGLGVRENSYAVFLVPAILTNSQAVAFGAMWILAVTVSSAIGGLWAFLSGDLKLLSNLKLQNAEAVAFETAGPRG
jgi:hypothetical protein